MLVHPVEQERPAAGPVTVSLHIDQAEWDEFVEGHREATGYHLWRWRSVFSDVFGHTCDYLSARRDGLVTGILPLVYLRSWLLGYFGVSLPFVNYGGVLASDESSAKALVAAATDRARTQGLAHIELRHRRRHDPTLAVKQHKVTMLLPLVGSAEAMWSGLDRKVRNQIRKAEKSGLDTQVGGGELLGAFYPVFARNMRDLGTPVYPREFFEAVLGRFSDRTRVFVVRREDVPIAAAISYAYRQTIEVPWAASIKEHLPLCPNNLLYWSIIRYAIDHGFRTLDFGRSTPDEGTFHFKRQWGAEPLPLFWEYQLLSSMTLPDQSVKNPKFRLAISAWKRLPVSVATRLGPSIVRGIP